MGFDAPDHDLINRSSAGPSTGAMPGVQFGTGSGRETQHAHLHDFYHAVDRGVSELLRSTQAPLVLAGVEEDVAIYRSISAYPNLLEQGIHGSPGAPVTPLKYCSHAHDIALFISRGERRNEMAEAKERLAPATLFRRSGRHLRAAVEGRVSDLYLDETAAADGDVRGESLRRPRQLA